MVAQLCWVARLGTRLGFVLERCFMHCEAWLPVRGSQASVCLDLATVNLCDSGLVNSVAEETLPCQRAGLWFPHSPRAAARPGLVLRLGLQLPQQLAVVPRDLSGHIGHGAVGKFYCMSVEDAFQGVAIRERRIQCLHEYYSYGGFYVWGKRWVEQSLLPPIVFPLMLYIVLCVF